ncbi:MAG TPA: hypothetical protein PLY17_18075 [Candidatus Hydrogenedentes bacterium]|nr:hypothetical protein [Candidatus Hydrogenedentota bacterium]
MTTISSCWLPRTRKGDHAAVGETLKIGAALARLMSELIELRSQMERVASRLERS